MRSHRPLHVVAIGLVCLLAVIAVSVIVDAQRALAQDQPRAPAVPEAEGGRRAERRDQPEGERRQRPERGDEARRFQEMRERRVAAEMMMARQMPAIAVADGKVFVVFGGVLYKFDAETLAIEGQQRIPRPAPPFEDRPGREGRPERPPAEGPAREGN